MSVVCMQEFLEKLPKAELHVHLEGTLEADLKIKLAERNNHPLRSSSAEEIRQGYVYHDLPSFLTLYYEGVELLQTEQDFHDLCYDYLKKVAQQNVLYTEMFFDPQLHTRRGIALGTVIRGFNAAQEEAEKDFGIRSHLIMCFIREMSADSADETFTQALPYLERPGRSRIIGVGLDSDEKGNPPAKFAKTFARARALGLHLTMHCDLDQQNTHEHIRQALQDLGSERLDHGLNVLEKPELIAMARDKGVTFTLCPSPNDVIRPGRSRQDIRDMLAAGLKITINSDDPGYMQSVYMTESFAKAQSAADLTRHELIQISRNAFQAAWISDDERALYLDALETFARNHRVEMSS
ncbi:adenosine deaminase [Gluconobacter cerinus]|uniref:adenosine deaminase n=1 Tax=Gluconobacter cerinus TaxID=38307 RepID=UPI001B8B6ACB|nr:adenosine deaminase [Gluconobacter cerinus]MBS1071901.1 adenosine deaminase [Gluconobacter cerinus]